MWATDTIPAEYPPVVAFKAHVDSYILEHYGIAVEHYCATRFDGVEKEKVTYNDGFYHVLQSGNNAGTIKGFPMQRGPWCQKLKLEALKQAEKMTYEKLFYHIRESGNRKGEICGFPFIGYPECQKALKVGAIRKMEKAIRESGGKLVQYLGIAADEPDRIATHIGREGIRLPLVELGWEEDLCGLWCKYNGLLSPTYENADRDGCWFCHNQGVDQLRSLRKMYPDLWELLLKWDIDSPVTFKPGRGGKPGKTVHDYERRFKLEDDGVLTPGDARFRWSQIDEPIQLSLF